MAVSYALRGRLSQILGDAVLDGILGRNPCSKRTTPPMGKQKVDTYGHLWPDTDESTRRVIASVITERVDSKPSTAYPLRTAGRNQG